MLALGCHGGVAYTTSALLALEVVYEPAVERSAWRWGRHPWTGRLGQVRCTLADVSPGDPSQGTHGFLAGTVHGPHRFHLFALRVGLQPIVWQYGDSPTAATPAAGHGRQRRDGRGGRSLLGAPPHARHLADRRCPLCAAHACTGRPSGLLGPHVASRPPVQIACIITCNEVAPTLGGPTSPRLEGIPCLLPLAPAPCPGRRPCRTCTWTPRVPRVSERLGGAPPAAARGCHQPLPLVMCVMQCFHSMIHSMEASILFESTEGGDSSHPARPAPAHLVVASPYDSRTTAT